MERLTKFDYENYRALKPKQDVVDKLGELEDVLEKWHIEDLDKFLEEQTVKKRELNDILWKMEQELAELKRKAIMPKFKIGDKVYGIIDTWAYTDVRPVDIRGTHLLYEVWDGEDTTKQHSTRIFATKEEAEQKLAQFKGEE